MTIGEKLLKLRQENGLSQKELAEKLEVSTGKIAEWESDEILPSFAEIAKISRTFNVTADFLILETEVTTVFKPENKTIKKVVLESCEKKNDDNTTSIKKKRTGKTTVFICATVLIMVFFVVAYNLLLPFSKNTSRISKAEESVVKVLCYDPAGNETATGSGFISLNNKTVVTNYHVIEDAYTCKISTNQDKTYEVNNIINYSEKYDIAILSLKESTGLEPLKCGNSDELQKGEVVTAIGSPLGLKNTVSQGILSGRLMEQAMDVLQFTAAISSGSSGGALFNDDGEVIGVTYASYVDGQNLNLAIPIEKVKELYEVKSEPIKTDELYLEIHPTAKYIDNYDNVIDVTFQQIQNHPNAYVGKKVRFTGYVSSILVDGDEAIGYICADAGNCSGDFNYDREDDRDANYRDLLYTGGIVDKGIDTGDKVIVYATVSSVKISRFTEYILGKILICKD